MELGGDVILNGDPPPPVVVTGAVVLLDKQGNIFTIKNGLQSLSAVRSPIVRSKWVLISAPECSRHLLHIVTMTLYLYDLASRLEACLFGEEDEGRRCVVEYPEVSEADPRRWSLLGELEPPVRGELTRWEGNVELE